MRKTTLSIDDDLIERAQRVLGTHGIKDTVDRALQEVIAQDARDALIRRLKTLEGTDIANEEIMKQAWRD